MNIKEIKQFRNNIVAGSNLTPDFGYAIQAINYLLDHIHTQKYYPVNEDMYRRKIEDLEKLLGWRE